MPETELRSKRSEVESNEEASPFLTTKLLARRWLTTEQAIHSMRHRGDAPKATRVGKQLLFHVDDVRAYESAKAA